MQVCVVYIVEEVASFWELGKLMSVAHNRTHSPALQTSRMKAACSLCRNWN